LKSEQKNKTEEKESIQFPKKIEEGHKENIE
jgi:hypothetical protein